MNPQIGFDGVKSNRLVNFESVVFRSRSFDRSQGFSRDKVFPREPDIKIKLVSKSTNQVKVWSPVYKLWA